MIEEGFTLDPEVSVVIPTVLRPSLRRAVESVYTQTLGPSKIELIVVADVDHSDPRLRPLELGQASVYSTGGRKRGGAARNLGAQKAVGNWVAYLDDDDVWAPQKLEVQLKHLREQAAPERAIVSSRVMSCRPGHKEQHIGPNDLIRRDQRVEDYLFCNRKPSLGRPSLYTSTLLMSRQMAQEIPWDESLTRHQDWDLLMKMQTAGATFSQTPEPLVEIWLDSPNSISAHADWKSSFDWARAWKQSWAPRTYADFLAAQTLRYATQSRSAAGVRTVLKEIASVRRAPHLGSTAMGFGGLVPRKLAFRALTTVSRRS